MYSILFNATRSLFLLRDFILSFIVFKHLVLYLIFGLCIAVKLILKKCEKHLKSQDLCAFYIIHGLQISKKENEMQVDTCNSLGNTDNELLLKMMVIARLLPSVSFRRYECVFNIYNDQHQKYQS